MLAKRLKTRNYNVQKCVEHKLRVVVFFDENKN